MSGRGILLVSALGAMLALGAAFLPVPPARIVADTGLFDAQVARRERMEGRPLTAGEFRRMQARFIDEELLLAYARTEGLDRSSYVERRLARKIRFLLSGEAPEVSEAELRAIYDAHPERFVPAGAMDPLPFDRVRDSLRDSLLSASTRARIDERVQDLLARYDLVIED